MLTYTHNIPRVSLEDFLAPHKPDEFFSSAWGRSPLLIAGDSSKVSSVCLERTGIQLLDETLQIGAQDSENRHRATCLLALENGTKYEDAQPYSDVRLSFDSAQNYVTGEATAPLRVFAADELVPVLSEIAAAVAMAFGLRGGTTFERPMVVLLFNPANAYTMPFRIDNSHSFELQLDGEKHWTVSRSVVGQGLGTAFACGDGQLRGASGAEPLVDPATGDPLSIDKLALQEFTASPGDLVYIPPGTPYRSHSENRSVSVLFGLSPATLGHICKSVLGRLVDECDLSASPVPPQALGRDDATVAAVLEVLAEVGVRGVAPETVFSALVEYGAQRTPHASKTELFAPAPTKPGDGDRFQHHAGALYATSGGDGGDLCLYTGYSELEVESEDEIRVVQYVLRNRLFSVDDISNETKVAKETAFDVVSALLDAGVLCRAPQG